MAEETRQRIVAATNELFRRVGYNGAGLAEISRTSEATTGSIYHFFPGGKSELARAVVTETGAAYRELFELILGAEERLADGVSAFFDAAGDVLETDDFIDPCPIGTVAREVASTDDELRRAASRVFNSWVDALSQRLVALGAAPESANTTATTVIAMIEGGFIMARTHRDGDVMRRMGQTAALLIDACQVAQPSRSTKPSGN